MSVKSIALVLSHSKAKGTAKVIMLALANHDGPGGIWPSIATLSRYANVDRVNVQRALQALRRSGELVIDEQGGGSESTPAHMRPNRYEIRVECPGDALCSGPPEHRPRRLPQSAADLWTEGAAETQPRCESAAPGGRADAAPGGCENAARTVRGTTPMNVPPIPSAYLTDRPRNEVNEMDGPIQIRPARKEGAA